MWRKVSNKALCISNINDLNLKLSFLSIWGLSRRSCGWSKEMGVCRKAVEEVEEGMVGMNKLLKNGFLRYNFKLHEIEGCRNDGNLCRNEGSRDESSSGGLTELCRNGGEEFRIQTRLVSSFSSGSGSSSGLLCRNEGLRVGSSSGYLTESWRSEGERFRLGRRSVSSFSSVSGSGFRENGCGLCGRCYSSVAEALSSSDAEVEVEEKVDLEKEVKEILDGILREERVYWRKRQKRYATLRRRQTKMEAQVWKDSANDYQEYLADMCKHKRAPNLPPLKMMFLGWFEPLVKVIKDEQDGCGRHKKFENRANLEQLPAEMIAVITMHTLMALLMTGVENGKVPVINAALQIGEAIENEVKVHRFLQKTKTKKGKGKKNQEVEPVVVVTSENIKLRRKVEHLIRKQKLRQVGDVLKSQDDPKSWGRDARCKVGSLLIELLIELAYIQPPVNQLAESSPDIRPAFKHYVKTQKVGGFGLKRLGYIECDPLIRRGLEKGAKHVIIRYRPMLVPPVKWTRYDRGAYLYLPSYVMRFHGAKRLREALKKTPYIQLRPVYEALDTLGNTKWRINKRVLQVVETIWTSGGTLADLVDRDDVPVPVKPDTDDEEEIKKWRFKRRCAKKENSERHSQRCDVELKLDAARKLKDEDSFFFPHNVDFRGRAYPMPAHLNHLGSDLCRGVLEFGEGRPLGKIGLRWLKIHLANLFAGGVDKLSYDGRIAFTESHLDDIFDSADKPLEGERWWLKAEDPFQCLAACINISEALRSSSPESFISHMPVHQDGSCNGLQHYAALGRDKLGAAAVNLVDVEKPADVYSGISARVLVIMRKDAQKDPDTDPDALHAKLLINEVDRKMVKQTVMTSVYGVTYIGARDQIKKRLKERGAIADHADLFGASCYAAKVTLTALGEMFEDARNIMNWLSECAKAIASENQSVRWTTPVGLPVVQPYHKHSNYVVRTPLQNLSLTRETDKVLVKRQKTAFPPNFVHSLDASHMMMTATACRKAGLNFAGVHDSYWTHACDVDDMNVILREKFVELYQQPILEDLLEQFEKSFPMCIFPPLPDRGDFDLTEVLRATYFFN